MKKIILSFTLVSFVIVFVSCNNENDEISPVKTTEQTLESVNPYNFIGELHNAAMDSVKANNFSIDELKIFTLNYAEDHFNSVKFYDSDERVETLMDKIIQTSFHTNTQHVVL